jgi:hypothetical protein
MRVDSTFISSQEGAARKDVARAFGGVFQGKWKSIATPIQTLNPKYMRPWSVVALFCTTWEFWILSC